MCLAPRRGGDSLREVQVMGKRIRHLIITSDPPSGETHY